MKVYSGFLCFFYGFEQETLKSDVSKLRLQSLLDSPGEAAQARGRLPLSAVSRR